MMFYKGYSKPIVIALGFFDGVHIGHRKIFDSLKRIGQNCEKAVFTIKGDFFKNSNGNIYTFREKKQIFASLGIDKVIYAKAEQKFFSLSKQEFLDILLNKYNIKGIVVGEDFTFGYNAKGNAQDILEFCKKNNIYCKIEKLVCSQGKVSSQKIKEYLSNGQIKKANNLLGQPYYIYGQVCVGRKVGSTQLVPTANVNISQDKLKLKLGVYSCLVQINGKEYKAISSYGNSPTFRTKRIKVESYIFDFQGNLYGEKIKIYFLDYIRELKKFSSVNELKKQIKLDMECK